MERQWTVDGKAVKGRWKGSERSMERQWTVTEVTGPSEGLCSSFDEVVVVDHVGQAAKMALVGGKMVLAGAKMALAGW